jgi:hypothetical protein
MSFLDGIIGGVADQGTNILNNQMAEERAQRQAEFGAQMDEAKLRTRMQLEREYADGPLNRVSAAAQSLAGTQVPVAPQPVTTADGAADKQDFSTDAPVHANMTGKYSALVKAQSDPTDPSYISDAAERRSYLSAVTGQFKGQAQDAANAVAGQTRPMSSDEQLQGAMDKLKITDPAAYAAGLPLIAPKTISVADGAAILDAKSGKVIYQNSGKEERQEENNDRKDDRQDKAIQAAIDRATNKQETAGTLTPEMEVNAKAIANGQLAPISGYGLRSPGAAMIMARVLEINPDYSAKDYGTGSKAEKDFATGKLGNTVRSFNVALAHLDTLSNLADALDNNDTQIINKIGNAVATQTGAAAPTNFNAAKHIVADEIVKAVTGSSGALGDREAAAKTVDAANSPAQLKGVINTYKELMNGQLTGLRYQYQATTGKKDFDDKYLMDGARAMSQGMGSSRTAAPSGMPSDISSLVGKYGG